MSANTRVFVARLTGLSVFDPLGDQVGRVRDVVVMFPRSRPEPRVIGLVVEVPGRRRVFVPMTRVTSIDAGAVITTGLVNMRRFEQRIAEVGEGNWSRTVRTILGPEHDAQRLLLGETINPPGNWSSYPPHRHDRHNPPEEVDLEEVYLFRTNPAGGFGVQGEVRLKSFCADPEAIAAYAPLVTEGGRSFGVRLLHPIPGAFAARLTGVATREEAEALRGTRLYAPRDRLPPLADDEFYHADLIGLACVDAEGEVVGTVTAIENYGAGDLLEIELPNAKRSLIPFREPIAVLGQDRVTIDPKFLA